MKQILCLLVLFVVGIASQTTPSIPQVCRCQAPGDQKSPYGYRCFYWAGKDELGTFRPDTPWDPSQDFGKGNYKVQKNAAGNKYVTSGKWKCTADILLREDAITCKNLQPPQFGTVNQGSFTPGSTADFACNPGYRLVGPQELRCSGTGQWSASPPTCTTAICPSLSDPLNGKVTFASPPTVGTSATYSCNAGYSLVGARSRRCNGGSKWGLSAPTCQKRACAGKKAGSPCDDGNPNTQTSSCEMVSGQLQCVPAACHNFAYGKACKTSAGAAGKCTRVGGDVECVTGACAGLRQNSPCNDGNSATGGDKCVRVGANLVCRGSTCPTTTKYFSWKKGVRRTYFRMPKGCTKVNAYVWGAGGGPAGSASGGGGGYIGGNFLAKRGRVVYVYVGGAGGSGTLRVRNRGGQGQGGTNGGGSGGGGDYPNVYGGGGGGGYSGVYYSGWKLIAGGGGGGAMGGSKSSPKSKPYGGGAGGGNQAQNGYGPSPSGMGKGGLGRYKSGSYALGAGGTTSRYSGCTGGRGRTAYGGHGKGGWSRCTARGVSPNGGGGGGAGAAGGGGGIPGGAGGGGSSWAHASVSNVQNNGGSGRYPGNRGDPKLGGSSYAYSGRPGRVAIQLSA
eukprot:TRINITY_DN66127_c5_g1_i1.p1 TRINITY_DN66127_c5_g1~~TRINITY_DN66127_c5_g1_i1.p1  ORF type:complete len:617 (+),score=136.40 TRINITY_DN66127_c5_g1_i1:42-1892(+)